MSLPIGNPPATEFPRKRSRCPFPAVHLPRKLRKSVPGVTSCRPPGTESPRQRSRCPFPAVHLARNSRKVFQVSFPAFHLARNSCESVPGGISLPPTWHGIPAKACQVASPRRPPGTESPRKRVRWHLPAAHLARNPRESVSGGISPPSTCHGIPAKAFQVSHPAVHLPRQFLSSWDVGAFQQDKLVVCSMKRVAVYTPAAAKYMHLSENHDVSRMVQLRVSHVWTHLQLQNDLTDAYRAYLSLRVCRVMLHLEMTISCDCLIIRILPYVPFAGVQ